MTDEQKEVIRQATRLLPEFVRQLLGADILLLPSQVRIIHEVMNPESRQEEQPCS
jgi:hypothetical protein